MLAAHNGNAPANVIARDIKGEMTRFMTERGECTREDLLQRFTPQQIDRYGASAARAATRRAEGKH